MNWSFWKAWLEEENSRHKQNDVWKSRYKSLKKLFADAEWLGCSTYWMAYATIANLCCILKYAKIAARRQDNRMSVSFSPAAIRICDLTMSTPVTASVTGCSTCTRALTSMK